jgi:iron complex outermembrane receptor protein
VTAALWTGSLQVKAADADSTQNTTAQDISDEIIVTARYRKENAQDVPISIAALSGEQLANQGAINLSQVIDKLPSLNIQGFPGSFRNQSVTIRGIGSNSGTANDGLEPGVGIYVDGVYSARNASVLSDLLDVESIEVLRGPQGTLFGKNTVAGAVDIRTREPSFESEGTAEISYGNYNYVRTYVSADSTIDNDIAFRVSYAHTQRDGIIYNTLYHEDWDNLRDDAERFDVIYKPSEDFKLRLITDYSNSPAITGFLSVIQILPTTLANGTQLRGFTQRAIDVGYTPSATFADPFARTTDIDMGRDGDYTSLLSTWGSQAHADWDVGPVTLSSITGYRNWDAHFRFDGDSTGANILPQSTSITNFQQFSQEARLFSPGGQTIDYTAGLYFFWEKAADLNDQSYGTDAVAWLLTPNNPKAAVSSLPSAALNGLVSYADVVPVTHSYAGYSQATWNISPAFRVTGGLRYTYEHKTGLYNPFQGGDAAPISSFPAAIQGVILHDRDIEAPNSGGYSVSNNTGNVSGAISIAYDFSSDIHSYVSYSRGYKSPGINLVAQSTGVDIFVKPETVDAYEIGMKSRWMDGKFGFNGDLFWTNDYNYQANNVNRTVTPIIVYVSNIGTVQSRGAEFDISAKPLDGLTFDFGGAYDKATYLNYTNAQAPYLTSYLGTVNLSGRPLAGASKWAYTESVEYVRNAGALDLYIGGDGSYRSGFYGSVNLDPFSYINGYALYGLHAGVRDAKGHWEVSAWVRNLLDKDYITNKNVSTTYGIVTGALGEPRMFGASLKRRF